MNLFENCETYFGTDNLYRVLSVPENATQAELKKAYKKRSLIVHPDRVEESKKEEATKKFQVLAKVHSILANEEQRKIYDDTGEVDEENAVSEDQNCFEYWRLLFPKVTIKEIDAYLKKYKGSTEETYDLIKCYVDCVGDMNKMCNYIIGYEFDEEERYREILMRMIQSKDIPNFTTFTQETQEKQNARRRKYQSEAKEAEALRKVLKIDNEDENLASAIMKRASERKENFDRMIAGLIQKYANLPDDQPEIPIFSNGPKTKRAAAKRKYQNEDTEAEALRMELNIDDEDENLASALMRRAIERKKNFEDMITYLKQKYVIPKPKVKRSKK